MVVEIDLDVLGVLGGRAQRHGAQRRRRERDEERDRLAAGRLEMKTLARLARCQQGFTLTELLVVITILSVMLAGLLSIQMTGQTSYLIGAHRVEAQQNARVALELLVRELRSAVSVTAVPSGTNMTFVDENNSVIQYQLAGTTLNRTATGCAACTGVATPVIGGVRAFTLTYYKAYDGSTNTGTPTAVASR